MKSMIDWAAFRAGFMRGFVRASVAGMACMSVLAVLAGCGGGDPEEDQRTTIPVDCKQEPKRCA